MASNAKTIHKFKSSNKIFIAAIDSVNYFDLLKFLKPKLQRTNFVFLKGTIFYLLAGIHHEPSSKDHGQPGKTDPSLLSQFHHTLLKHIQNICGFADCKQCQKLITMNPCTTSIWKDMDYKLKVRPLETVSGFDHASYELSTESRKNLEDLSKELCNQTIKDNANPSALIFASCYSLYSNITDILRTNGILAIMNISKDKGEVSEGKAFHLDVDKRRIIHKLIQPVS